MAADITLQFDGLSALVTGASQGIGAAIAQELCARGAHVAIVARGASRLEAAAAAAGPRALAVPCDVTQDDAVEELVNRVKITFGGLDILVHAAGAVALGRIGEAPISQLDELLLINVRAPYVLTSRLLPLIKARQGQVAFVNSSIVRSPRTEDRGAYAASKFALLALANALRDEVNKDGVRVITVYPGTTATPRQETLHAEAGKDYAPERLLQPRDVAMTLCDALALPRTAEPTDIYIRQMLPPLG